MTQELKELIERINREAVESAQSKAREIEQEAQKKAREIISEAEREAKRLILEAEAKIRKEEERKKQLLSQAARDMLLGLKGQIIKMLQGIILAEIRNNLNPQELAQILSKIIQKEVFQDAGSVSVELSKEDLEKLQGFFLERLKQELKKGIVLYPVEDIQAGLRISFDSVRSQFDFSDTSLAEYIVNFLKPQLKNILDGGQ